MKQRLRKYSAILVISIKDAINFRAELLLWTVIDAMPLVAILALWLRAFESAPDIGGFTRATIVSYYLVGYIFQDMTGAHFEETSIREIRDGSIAKYLLKPFSLQIGLVVRELGWRLMTFLVTGIPFMLLLVVFAPNVLKLPTPGQLLILLYILVFAYLLDCLYSLFIVAMGFVIEEAESLSHLKWMLGWLFSGSMLPFEMMPGWLAKLSSVLPFQFRYYIPVEIYLGKIEGLAIVRALAMQMIWVAVLSSALVLIWNRNLKRFTAVGS